MKLLPLFLLLAAWANAAEPVQLPLEVGTLTMRDGKVYENAKVIGQDAVGVKITHAGGTARIPFEKLPKALSDRFPRDNAAAKKQREAEAKAETAHDKAVAKADVEEAGEKNTPLENLPDAAGDNHAKITALEAYVRRMEVGIESARIEADNARQRASAMRADANYTVTTTGSDGYVQTYQRTNNSKLTKANFYDRQARNAEAKITQAQSLITGANEKIDLLERAAKGK